MSDLKIPTQIDLMWPTLKALVKMGGSASIQEISKEIAEILELPDEMLEKLHGERSQSELDYRAAWARTRLKKMGAVKDSSPRDLVNNGPWPKSWFGPTSQRRGQKGTGCKGYRRAA